MTNRKTFIQAVVLVSMCVFMTLTAEAATVVQPDIRIGASYIKVETFGPGQGQSDSGGQIDASIRLAYLDDRTTFSFTPKLMQTYYSGSGSLEREEQELSLAWSRLFKTGDSNIRADYSRKDLFSSEFEDFSPEPDVGDNQSGVVGQGTRDRFSIRGGFSKQLSGRGDLVADFTYLDNQYKDTGSVNRVDFDQATLSAGYRFRRSERFSVRATAGGRQYNGNNNIEVDSINGEVRAEWKWTEVRNIYLGIGFESLDATLQGQSIGSEDIIPFEFGVVTQTERTMYNFNLARYARPVSTGEFRDRLRASFQLQREISQRLTFLLGIAAYREDDLADTGGSNSRDYITGNIDIDWSLGPKWSLGLEYFHNEQRFDGVILSPDAIKSRDEFFLNIRFLGLDRTKSADSSP